jgi:hypothetical protein
MTTGVDAQTCKLIVLDSNIGSMTEFKQIIGRGTRINEDYGKLYFTIMDFKRATALFADPAFDGDPVQIYEPDDGKTVVPPDDESDPGGEQTGPGENDSLTQVGGEVTERPTKYVVNNVEVRVATERVQYLDEQGKLITEPNRSGTTPARPSAKPTPRSMPSSPSGTTPRRSRPSWRNSPPKACSLMNSPSRWAATTTPSISSATSHLTLRRSRARSGLRE